jgi:hypothetical protein
MEEKKEMKLPVIHDRCPVCGCTDGLVRMAIDRAVEEKKISKEAFSEGAVLPVMLMDPRRPPVLITVKSIKVPCVMIYFEVCSACGVMYCRKFDVTEQDIPVQFEPQRGHHMGLQFGKG